MFFIFRCLNPDSNKDPTKWGAYNPNQFANALSKEYYVSSHFKHIFKLTIYKFKNIIYDLFIKKYMINDGRK